MLRYKTETRPGLVALYDIRPGTGPGQFLSPRSPHGYVCAKENVFTLFVCLIARLPQNYTDFHEIRWKGGTLAMEESL